MLKTVIIDDVIDIRNDIRDRLTKQFNNDILVIGEAESIEHGSKLIDTLHPDLVLLDVELKDGICFDLLKKLHFNNFQLIFITGFNEHAIKAIKIGALDYILKPIDDTEFNDAIDKAIASSNQKNKELNDKPLSNQKLQIDVSNDYFKGVKKKRIVLKTLEAHFIVYVDELYIANRKVIIPRSTLIMEKKYSFLNL